jgi:hypothetical protein
MAAPLKKDEEGQGRGARPFVVLLIMIALAIGSWFVLRKLSDMSQIQDCVMSGRSNCAPVEGQ